MISVNTLRDYRNARPVRRIYFLLTTPVQQQPDHSATHKFYGDPIPTGRPQFGSAKGQITVSDDFDEPLADFNDYM